MVDAVSAVVQKTQIDSRSSQTVTSIPMAALVLGALMQALTGDTDCVSIGDFVVRNREFFKRYIPDCSFEHVSHDTVRRSLMLIAPERFEKFYLKILEPLVAHTVADVVAVDGQAVRASAKTSKDNDTLHEPSMIMNVFDVGNRVCLAQRRIENKTNEITVGPQMIEDLDLWGTVVTADAMNCQVGFVQAVCRQADYCISLKGNQERSWKEAMYLFNTTDPSRIASHVGEWELDHGRIERRTISAISGRLLSEPIRKKWPGLTGGALVRVMTEKTKKSTGKQSVDVRYYITSLPGDEDSVERLGEVIRAHWGIENRLHWMLDNLFRQDRMQADNPNYLSNRCALNKLALAMLENYQFHLWDTDVMNEKPSLRLLQQRCRDPKIAIECIACALGCLPR